MSESGSAVSHIKTERNITIEHILDSLYHVFCRTRLMFSSPMVEPATPEFTAHQRSFRTKFFQFLELLVYIGACSEVDGPDQVVECIPCKVTAPVALEERYIGKTGFAHQVAYGRNIRLVSAVRTVFVLHLHHDNISALIYL